MTPTETSPEAVNILLVDDRQENLVALSAILSETGHNLVTADSGAKALGALLRYEFAVILLDVKMPETDGYNIASLIKEREATRHIPIIFLTGVATDIDQIYHGYEVGAVDYLLKPLDPVIVRHKVAVFVDLFLKERRIQRQGQILREMERKEHEFRLALQRQESEAWYSTTLRSIGDAVIATDAQGVIQFMNPVAESLTGWTLQEAKGRPLENVFKIFSEETREEAENPAVRVIREGKTVGLANHTILVSRTGAEFVIEDSAAPIRSKQGAVLGVVFNFRDTTNKRRDEWRQAFLSKASAALLSSLDYAPVLDPIVKLASTSIADCCLIRVRRNDGGTEATASSHHDPKLMERIRDVASRIPDEASTEPFAQSGDGLPKTYQGLGFASCLTAPIMLRGNSLGTITLLLNEGRTPYGPEDVEMAGAVAGHLATAIEKSRLYDAAQKAIRLRDEFVSIASHELRTPLTPLKTELYSIRNLIKRRKLADYPAEKLDELLAVMDRQVGRLSRLVEDLLDVSRIDIGRMKLEKADVDLEWVVHETLKQFSDELRRAGCSLEVHTVSAVGSWDRMRIEQVLNNLLANAMKYGAGKPIKIAIEKSTDLARFAIRDHGIGIAPEDQRRLFERFGRAVPAGHFPGLGLGLYISRQIVEAHGGHIRVESEPGQGATFIMELPLKKALVKAQAA